MKKKTRMSRSKMVLKRRARRVKIKKMKATGKKLLRFSKKQMIMARKQVKKLYHNRQKILADLKIKQKQLKVVEGKIKRYTKKSPLKALGIAVLAGAVAGATYKMVKRRRR